MFLVYIYISHRNKNGYFTPCGRSKFVVAVYFVFKENVFKYYF